MVVARENGSSCSFNVNGEETWIYCFGGFDKKAIENIERIKLTYSDDVNETENMTRPIINSKWELLKDITMEKSVECCGTLQYSNNEIMIFGGFQKGEAENR